MTVPNLFIHNVVKWPDILLKSCGESYIVVKVRTTEQIFVLDHVPKC